MRGGHQLESDPLPYGAFAQMGERRIGSQRPHQGSWWSAAAEIQSPIQFIGRVMFAPRTSAGRAPFPVTTKLGQPYSTVSNGAFPRAAPIV